MLNNFVTNEEKIEIRFYQGILRIFRTGNAANDAVLRKIGATKKQKLINLG